MKQNIKCNYLHSHMAATLNEKKKLYLEICQKIVGKYGTEKVREFCQHEKLGSLKEL